MICVICTVCQELSRDGFSLSYSVVFPFRFFTGWRLAIFWDLGFFFFPFVYIALSFLVSGHIVGLFGVPLICVLFIWARWLNLYRCLLVAKMWFLHLLWINVELERLTLFPLVLVVVKVHLCRTYPTLCRMLCVKPTGKRMKDAETTHSLLSLSSSRLLQSSSWELVVWPFR